MYFFYVALGTNTRVSDEEVNKKVTHAKLKVDRMSLDKDGG